MLITSDRFIGMPIMSLQTGSELARTSREIIDPRNLSIVAYELEGPTLDQHPSLLRVADIREIGPLGAIIDSADEIVGISDVIALKEVYEFDFSLHNKPVIDDQNHKLGKVTGYTLGAGVFLIQQLQIRRPLLKSFGDTELLIHRSQIVKISDEKITVKSTSTPHHAQKQSSSSLQLTAYNNPFRKRQQQTQSSK